MPKIFINLEFLPSKGARTEKSLVSIGEDTHASGCNCNGCLAAVRAWVYLRQLQYGAGKLLSGMSKATDILDFVKKTLG